MAQLAIWFGGILVLLGVAGYGLTWSPTSLIPAGFGLLLVVLGVLARNPKMRMHAMHGAALVGLLGFGVPAFMIMRGALAGTIAQTLEQRPLAIPLQAAMSLISLIFVALCVKSFIDARRQRKQEATGQPS